MFDHLLRENIKNLSPYSSARDEFTGTAEIYLDANENPYPFAHSRYPDPYQRKLKRKISEIRDIDPKNIFLGNGSDEIIDLLIRTFCVPGKEAIMSLTPSYGMYKVSAGINDVTLDKVFLNEDFSVNVASVISRIKDDHKLIFLCSPNNPTGLQMNIADITDIAEAFDGIVVVDEAYIDFADGLSATTILDKYPNLIVSQTFSKAWGSAGLRLGMAFMHEELVRILNKVKPPYNVNSATQEIALAKLEQIEDYRLSIENIIVERRRVADALSNNSRVEQVYHSDANFILFRVDEPNKLFDYLINRGIVIRNRSTQDLCSGCLRITIGTPDENDTFLKELSTYNS